MENLCFFFIKNSASGYNPNDLISHNHRFSHSPEIDKYSVKCTYTSKRMQSFCSSGSAHQYTYNSHVLPVLL